MASAMLFVSFVGLLSLVQQHTPVAAHQQAAREQVAAAPADVPLRRVKPVGSEMRRLVIAGYTLSPTFRALVEELHQSNLIVVIEFGRCGQGRIRSCVSRVDSSGEQRSVRVKVDTRGVEHAIIATIAHELRHAAEIAGDRDAVDWASVMALYRRIGNDRCRDGLTEECETDQALKTESVVRRELDALR